MYKAWFEYYTVCIHSCTGFMDVYILHSVEAQLDFSERSGTGPSASRLLLTVKHFNLNI